MSPENPPRVQTLEVARIGHAAPALRARATLALTQLNGESDVNAEASASWVGPTIRPIRLGMEIGGDGQLTSTFSIATSLGVGSLQVWADRPDVDITIDVYPLIRDERGR